jgi:hypothetical protein
VRRDHRVGRSWPAPLAELGRWRSLRRERKRENAAAPKAAPAGVLRIARAAALWAIAVVIAVASGAAFAESYRGLYEWALRHGLAGFWAAAFPLQVDSFIGVGELVLFVATVDRWNWRHRAGAWLVALLGLAVSAAGNIGHIAAHDAQSRGTAAVPPFAAFASLWLGLAVLKRILARLAEAALPPGLADVVGLAAGGATSLALSAVSSPVPSDAESAAEASMRATLAAGNPWSVNQLQVQFSLTRAQATKLRGRVLAGANGHHAEDSGEGAAS